MTIYTVGRWGYFCVKYYRIQIEYSHCKCCVSLKPEESEDPGLYTKSVICNAIANLKFVDAKSTIQYPQTTVGIGLSCDDDIKFDKITGWSWKNKYKHVWHSMITLSVRYHLITRSAGFLIVSRADAIVVHDVSYSHQTVNFF